MNKIIWISAAVLSVAACAKNEVIPVNSGENQEIIFNVAPKTKVKDTQGHESFEPGKVFVSWAYYLAPGTDWDAKSDDPKNEKYPKEYISGATVSHDGTAWKAEKSYYWPKDGGKLTFFAYSLNKDNLTLKGDHSGFGCDPSFGISGAIDLQTNPNTDFLVADIAKDKTSNVQTHFTKGVPTLFRHRLSSVVFAIRTGEDYTDKKFELTNITLHNLYHFATYGQLPNEKFHPSASGNEPYIPIYTSTPQPIKFQDNFVNVTGVDKYIFIPQTFADNATIEVVYTITTKVPASDDVVETVTKTIKLNTLFPTDTGGWEMGKKYTIKLTFTLDEIYWDPAVEEWEPVTKEIEIK